MFQKSRCKKTEDIECHGVTCDELLYSACIGSASSCLASNCASFPFSFVVGALSAFFYISGSYLYSRSQLINTIPYIAPESFDVVKLPPINTNHMSKAWPQDIENDELFYLGVGLKIGFQDWYEDSPLKHSSIIFIKKKIFTELINLAPEDQDNHLQNNVYVFGRQSLAMGNGSASFFKSIWNDGFKTQVMNESEWELFEGAAFESTLALAEFSGQEIKSIIAKANQCICDEQTFNLAVNSNCYSATVYMLASAVLLSADKLESSAKDITQLKSIFSLMLTLLDHNFGQGVLNNKTVVEQVNYALRRADQLLVGYEEAMRDSSSQQNLLT